MELYPDIYIEKVTEITLEMLKENSVYGIIIDVDNTIIDIDKNYLEGIDKWCENLKQNGIKFCILSNTNKIKKVVKVANFLKIPFIYFAQKPNKKGFQKAMRIMNLNELNIAVVGDQILTDIWGGNKMGMYTILTKPINERDILITKIKRPIEKIILKKYLKSTQEKKGEEDVF